MKNIYEHLKDSYDVDVNDYVFDRDYILYPLKKNVRKPTGGYKYEEPYINDIQYLYFNCCLNLRYIADILGVKKETLEIWFNKYGIKRDNKDHCKKVREKTNLIKFGYTSYSSSNECKQKVKQTVLDRYGVTNVFKSEEVIKKSRQTNLKKYGVEYPQTLESVKHKQIETDKKNHNGVTHHKTKEFMEKSRKTKLKKYGDEYYSNREKAKETNLKKYGVENPSYCEEVKRKISIKNKELAESSNAVREKTNLERYGVESPAQQHMPKASLTILRNKELLESYIKENNILNCVELSISLGITNSSASRYVYKYNLQDLFNYTGSLQEKEIRIYVNKYFETENNTRKYLNGQEIDILIPDLKVGIEFNGDFWHNEYGRNKLYHQNKSLLAKDNGITLYHIFEYEWHNKKELIINHLNNILHINNKVIDASDCNLCDVNSVEGEMFLKENCLLHYNTINSYVGLYFNDELIGVAAINRHNNKLKIIDCCMKFGYYIDNYENRLLNYLHNIYDPNVIVLKRDIAHYGCGDYSGIGLRLDSISTPNCIWCKDYDVIASTKLTIKEMHKLGYYRIYDCGFENWIWKKS